MKTVIKELAKELRNYNKTHSSEASNGFVDGFERANYLISLKDVFESMPDSNTIKNKANIMDEKEFADWWGSILYNGKDI